MESHIIFLLKPIVTLNLHSTFWNKNTQLFGIYDFVKLLFSIVILHLHYLFQLISTQMKGQKAYNVY